VLSDIYAKFSVDRKFPTSQIRSLRQSTGQDFFFLSWYLLSLFPSMGPTPHLRACWNGLYIVLARRSLESIGWDKWAQS
jgi:hypothetical protein